MFFVKMRPGTKIPFREVILHRKLQDKVVVDCINVEKKRKTDINLLFFDWCDTPIISGLSNEGAF